MFLNSTSGQGELHHQARRVPPPQVKIRPTLRLRRVLTPGQGELHQQARRVPTPGQGELHQARRVPTPGQGELHNQATRTTGQDSSYPQVKKSHNTRSRGPITRSRRVPTPGQSESTVAGQVGSVNIVLTDVTPGFTHNLFKE